MKKINFRKSKYVIPAIMLPFIVLFFYIFNSWGNGQPTETVKTDSIPTNQINPTMPGVSSEVSDAGIKDKFDAYLEAYKHEKDASALDNIENGALNPGSGYSSAYTAEDIQRLRAQQKLDSLQRSLSSGQADIDRRMAALQRTRTGIRPVSSNAPISEEELLRGFTYNLNGNSNTKEKDPYNEQMRLFRDQMGIMDSMQKTYMNQATGMENGNPSTSPETSRARKTLTNNFNPKDFDPSVDSSFKPLSVSRNRGTRTGFNTISASRPENTIKAIIDENVKATAGSKVRIRLLNDIFVGEYLIPQGTYLYGVVSGFQTQRINISINQVMYENKPLPVQLDVFDNDGYLGLYVPNSNFREFTKELGTQGTQGLSQVRTSDNSNVTTGLINQLFQTTSTSVSKLIRQEKAFLKYNYIVYLKERNN